MGVKQLTSLVNMYYYDLYKKLPKLNDRCFIFDASALMYALMKRTKLTYGGNYDELYLVFKNYLISLQSLGVTIVVVLDGALNLPIKLDTILLRRNKIFNTLKSLHSESHELPKPLFTSDVLLEVLKDLRIKHVVAEREADTVIAVLANKLEATVVTNDSDFFLLHINHGVINIQHLLDIDVRFNKEVYAYNVSRFTRLFNIKKEYLKYLALLLGNDYSNDAILKTILTNCKLSICYSVKTRVRMIVAFLNKHENEQSILDSFNLRSDKSGEIEREVEKVLNEISMANAEKEALELLGILNSTTDVTNLSEHSYDVPTSSSGKEKLLSIKPLVHRGLVNSCVLNLCLNNIHVVTVQVENIDATPVSAVSRGLRDNVYVMLCRQNSRHVAVTEYRRYNDVLKMFNLKLNIELFAMSENVWKKKKICSLCMITSFDQSHLLRVKQHELVAIATRYWVQHSKKTVRNELVQAIVISYLLLQNSVTLPKNNVDEFSLDVAHHCSAWQSVLFYLIILNTLLNQPVSPVKMSKTFNGGLVQSIYKRLRHESVQPRVFLPRKHGLYEDMMDTILSS